MRKLIVTTACLVMGFYLSLNAQQKIETITPTFKPGWYIGLNGGANLFMGEGNNFLNANKPFVSPAKNIGFLGRAALGYNFTPIIGVRGMLGYHAYNWGTVPIATDGTYPIYKFGAENLTADLMVNLTNWWSGYKPDRKLDFSAFAGLGAAYLNNNVISGPVAGIFQAGLQADYHISPAVAINLMLDANLTTDNYNDLAYTPLPVDIFPELTLGLSYKLPEYVKKVKPVVEPKPVVEEPVTPPAVVAPETKPAVAKVDTPKVVKEVVPVVEKPQVAVVEPTKPVTEPVKEVTPAEILTGELNQHIFFSLNQREVVTNTQIETMQRIAAYVKQHPDAKIIVSGFADRNTGSIDANNQISKERAVNVANTLIRKYGVAYKNIMVKWYGGGIQPYEKAVKNRLVIVRTPNAKVYVAQPEKVYVPKVVEPVAKAAGDTSTVKPVVGDEGGLFLVVNFTDNQSDIVNDKQEDIIKKTADYLKRHPEARIAVSGYADKSSSSTDKNNILSKTRAVSVANALIQKYGIDSSRIQVKWYGAQKETYSKPSMNRLALIETLPN